VTSSANTPERSEIEQKGDATIERTLSAADSLRLHWPEYLMEAGESGLYVFSACAVATLLWHPASPLQPHLPSDAVRRILMGLAMGTTIIAIVLTPWGKQSGAHFNPAVTLTFHRLGKVASWDTVFYCAGQLLGAVAGVAVASFVLRGAPAHRAVHYAATMPGMYGDAVAFAAELSISFLLMSAVLFASNHRLLALYTLLCRLPGSRIHCLRVSLVRNEHKSCSHVRPRIMWQLLARPLDLFHRATCGHAGGG
jgi:glycerol uptake facilitator-like aquaporin